ncbi:MAG: hypothetical protein U1F07_10900 [Rubrivivax sp.]
MDPIVRGKGGADAIVVVRAARRRRPARHRSRGAARRRCGVDAASMRRRCGVDAASMRQRATASGRFAGGEPVSSSRHGLPVPTTRPRRR